MKEKIYKILGVEDFKTNKLYFFAKIVISLIFAITIALDSVIIFQGEIYGNISEIHFSSFELKNVLILFGVWIATYIILTLVQYLVDKLENTIYTKTKRKPKNLKVYFLIFIIILICWLPYLLSYFPGGVFSDTVNSLRQATGAIEYQNNNPLLYTFILQVCIMFANIFGGANQLGIEIFTVCQVLVMAAVIAYSIYWMYKRNISTKYLVLTTAFFGLCRLIPMYAISIWKDTPFCIALYMLTVFIAETIYQDGKNLEKISGIIKYATLMALVVFLRNNGLYIAIAITIVLMIVYRKNIFKKLKIFSIVSVVEIIIILIIQGPVYSHFKLGSPVVESLGVPIQQLFYVVAKEDGNLTQYQKDFIGTIYPLEKIKEDYNPCIVDPLKLDIQFNRQFLEDNKTQFLKVWLKVFLQNPVSYVEAYLLNTMGFWDVNKATLDGYINPQMWQNKDEIMGMKQTNYIEQATGYSIRDIIRPTQVISSAVFLFIILFSSIFTIYKKRYKNLIIYLPAFLTWCTVMIAVPLAFSFRYVYILFMVLPFAFLAPFLKQKKDETEKDKYRRITK